MAKEDISPRQELGNFANEGRLRDALADYNPSMSEEAIQLCIDVVIRYCEPRRTRRKTDRTGA